MEWNGMKADASRNKDIVKKEDGEHKQVEDRDRDAWLSHLLGAFGQARLSLLLRLSSSSSPSHQQMAKLDV